MRYLVVLLISLLPQLSMAQKAPPKAAKATKAPAPVPTQKELDFVQHEPEPERKPRAAESEARDQRWQYAVGVGIVLSAPATKYGNVKLTDASGTTSAEIEAEYTKEMSLILEGRYMAPESWGFIGGLNYEMERSFFNGSVTSSGSTTKLNGGAKIQFTTLYGSAVYRWEKFYVPFGLNYGMVSFKPASGFSGSHSENSDIGGQLGAGYYVTPNMVVEGQYWAVAVKQKTSSSGTDVDFGTALLNSWRVVGKYVF